MAAPPPEPLEPIYPMEFSYPPVVAELTADDMLWHYTRYAALSIMATLLVLAMCCLLFSKVCACRRWCRQRSAQRAIQKDITCDIKSLRLPKKTSAKKGSAKPKPKASKGLVGSPFGDRCGYTRALPTSPTLEPTKELFLTQTSALVGLDRAELGAIGESSIAEASSSINEAGSTGGSKSPLKAGAATLTPRGASPSAMPSAAAQAENKEYVPGMFSLFGMWSRGKQPSPRVDDDGTSEESEEEDDSDEDSDDDSDESSESEADEDSDEGDERGVDVRVQENQVELAGGSKCTALDTKGHDSKADEGSAADGDESLQARLDAVLSSAASMAEKAQLIDDIMHSADTGVGTEGQ